MLGDFAPVRNLFGNMPIEFLSTFSGLPCSQVEIKSIQGDDSLAWVFMMTIRGDWNRHIEFPYCHERVITVTLHGFSSWIQCSTWWSKVSFNFNLCQVHPEGVERFAATYLLLVACDINNNIALRNPVQFSIKTKTIVGQACIQRKRTSRVCGMPLCCRSTSTFVSKSRYISFASLGSFVVPLEPSNSKFLARSS